ncbi:unnamed protein product [Parajaminaea phylloscopi]
MAPPYAAYSQILPPTSPSHAVTARLTAGCSSASYPASRGTLQSHLVTARDDTIQVWEVRSRPGEEPKLWHLRTKTFFGSITGLHATRTIESESDARDRILLSFKDAKIALLEWNELCGDFETISIHTYERTSQLSGGLPLNFRPILTLDPESRCAALLLPKDALAVLPFTSSSDLELLDEYEDEDLYGANRNTDTNAQAGSSEETRSLHYSPSFVLPLSEVDDTIRNVRDFVFLPNFQKPTVALLCEPERESWTGSLRTHRDTLHLFIFTLDLSSTSHPVLSHFQSLPYDTLYLESSKELGGLIVCTSSAIFHLDQSGRMVGLQVNNWIERTTTNDNIVGLPTWQPATDEQGAIDLADSRIVWVEGSRVLLKDDVSENQSAQLENGTALLFLKDRRVLSMRFDLDGKTVTSLSLNPVAIPGSNDRLPVAPSAVAKIREGDGSSLSIFVASMLGNSRLVSIIAHPSKAGTDGAAHVQNDANGAMDIDLDDEAGLYGDSNGAETGSKESAASSNLSFELSICDTMHGLGPLGEATLAVVQDDETQEDVVKLVIPAGVEPEGGLVQLEDRLQARARRPVVDPTTDSGIPCDGIRKVKDNLFLIQHAEGPTSTSSLYEINGQGEARAMPSFSRQKEVLQVGWLEDRQFVAVGRHGLQICTVDSDQQQAHEQLSFDSQAAHAQLLIDSVSSKCQGVATVHRDGSVSLFQFRTHPVPGEVSASTSIGEVKLPRERMPRCTHAILFRDDAALFAAAPRTTEMQQSSTSTVAEQAQDEEVDYGDDLEDTDAQQRLRERGVSSFDDTVMIALLTSSGGVEVWKLQPEVLCVWRSNSLLDLPLQLECLNMDDPVINCSDLRGVKAEDFWVGLVGDEFHIAIVEQQGQLTMWTATIATGPPQVAHSTMTASNLMFNKRLTKQLVEPANISANGMSLVPPNGELPESLPRRFLSIQVDSKVGFDGPCLAISGSSRSGWIHKTRRGRLTFLQSASQDVRGIAVLGSEPSRSYVVADRNGLAVVDLPTTLNFDLAIPHTLYSTARQYTRIRTHPPTRSLVAASIVATRFVQFDTEDGTQVRSVDLDPQAALSKRGCLELFKHDWTEPIDGFEFEQNETVSALELLTLTSASSPTGLKDYIGVGTTVYNGEDRPTRGSMYVFEVVEVVPNRDDPQSNCRLKLLVKDDGKGPVTALSDISGYFVASIGQRMFVRAFEKQEALINVAFLDVGFLTTNIRRLGSTLLVSDLKKACIFVGFQEEPFRLSVFARHFDFKCYVTTAEYLIAANSMGFVSADWRGVVRLLEYNPSSADALAQRLTLRTELQTCTEYSSSLTRANSTIGDAVGADAGLAMSNEIILCGANGSLALVRPIASERLYQFGAAIANQMMRNARHAAALHPRGYRLVRNEAFSRPLYRGILDGLLLGGNEEQTWGSASRPKRQELIDLAGGVGRSEAGGSDGDAAREEEIVLAQLADIFG